MGNIQKIKDSRFAAVFLLLSIGKIAAGIFFRCQEGYQENMADIREAETVHKPQQLSIHLEKDMDKRARID